MVWRERLQRFRMGAAQHLVRLIFLWAAWGMLYTFVYQAQWDHYRKGQQALVPLHERMEEYGALISRVPNPEERIQELQVQLQRLQDQRMGENVIPQTVQRIAQTAAESRVILAAISPREDLRAAPGLLPEGVEKRSVEVRVRCEYPALGSFLGQLKKLPIPLTVDDLVVRSGVQDSPGLVEATLIISVYGLTS